MKRKIRCTATKLVDRFIRKNRKFAIIRKLEARIYPSEKDIF